MNKGLELIEAYHLFPVEPAQLEVVVHPQSIIHALVAYRDGSMLAQLASPDMRTPIALSLSWPNRMDAPTKRLNLVEIGQLSFERPDEARFAALGLARQAMRQGGTAPAVLNAANEIAVEAFLAGRLGFLQIAQLVAETLEAAEGQGVLGSAQDLSAVLAADATARRLALNLLGTGSLVGRPMSGKQGYCRSRMTAGGCWRWNSWVRDWVGSRAFWQFCCPSCSS